MGCGVNFLYLAGRQMRVYLCSRKRLMAKQLLNTAKVSAAVEHMGGEAVPQGMGTDGRIQASHFEVLIHFSADASGAEAFAVLIDKQHLAVEVAVELGAFISELHIVLDDLQNGGADGADSFFFALAPDMNDFAEEIDIVEVYRDNFTDPHTRAVKSFHNGPVACAQPCVGRRRFEKAFYLLVFEETREPFFLLWRADADDRIGAYTVPFDEELVEAAKGRQLACDGGLGVLLLVQDDEIASHGVDIDGSQKLVDIDLGMSRYGRGCPGVVRTEPVIVAVHFSPGVAASGEKLTELQQVNAIALGSMRTEAFFELEIV